MSNALQCTGSNAPDPQRGDEMQSSPDMHSGLPKACQFIFLKLGLCSLYPHKITVADLLSINSLSLTNNQPGTDSELWRYFVNKLMMLDVKCRYDRCVHAKEECTITSANEDDFFSFGEEINEGADEKTLIHPMDVHMAVFHCTDDFARERFISKLSACQFALPLLVPNLSTGQIEVPLYALQQIKKTWASYSQTGTVQHVIEYILSSCVRVVSFIRVGTSKISKSQIMNYILNDNKLPAFFSRHCDGNTKTRLLLDGVTEISWYCPGGSKDCIFQECVSLINLHGDANKYPGQLEFIQRISSVIVVLLPEDHREPEIVEMVMRLQETKIPLIFLFTGVEHVTSSSDNRIAAKNRNDAELKREIVSKVTCALHKQNDVQSLKCYIDTAINSGLITITESKAIWVGQQRAKHLMDILGIDREVKTCRDKLLRLKDEYLPLQGEHWNKWSKYDKEVHRLQSRRDMSIDQQITKVDSKKNKIRKAQQKESRNLNKFMAQFCKYALARTETNERIAMLNWLKKFLDDAFTGVVTDLQEQYHTTWTDSRKHTTEEDIKVQLMYDLKVISKMIKSASFKVHHIMREIAQIYEAVCSSQEIRAVCGFEVDRLPEFGAEIMMSGLAIELLDGDANHIPLKWISAVLDNLIQNIGDQRVFVISVLGLQSSGKSTLLNVMFGLQFAVSAGRCTKGAYMQLVPVHEELRDQLHFDYVLLVDTEGLQSVEADASLTHDNELATFVVGLGDVTIINVMGENTAEIQNILPICFQAFLRMASVEIKPRCFLVQQNITETAAKDKTQEGRRQLISKLDEMSKIAAQAEDREVTGFSDIIQFDAETHVFYFKNYFDGDPPMAPPNPSYTQNAQELKTKLLSIAEKQDGCKLPLISELKTRIQHLWNALMKENFVFHFKNALQYMVYSQLEEHYGKWSWKLRKHALETQNTLHYKIISNESHDTPTGQFKQDFDSIYQDIKGEVDKYFREEKYPEILVQWRNSIDKRLETLNTELIEETYAIERELINMKTYRLELDQRKRKYEADLLQKSKNLATQIKTEKLSEEELYVQFNTMWTEWENRVAAEKPQKNPRNIQAEFEKVLEICFQKFWNIIFPIKEEPCCNVDGIVKDSCKRFLRSLEKLMIFELASQRVQDGIEQILAKRDKENFGINDNFIHHMVSEINSMIEQYEKSSGIQFIGVIKAQIAVNACIKAVKNLKTLNENFIRTHDPLIYFNSKKEEYFNLFKHVFGGATPVTFFVRYLVNYLITAVQDAVTKKLCIDIVGDLKSNLPAFTGNRSILENYILKDLAEKEEFDLYVKYIHEPQNVLKMFITEHTEMYLSDKTKMERMVSAAWSSFIKPIISNSNLATMKLVETQGNVNASAWLDEFCGKLSGHMAISRMDLKNIEKEDLQDPDFFKKHFAERLKLAIDSGSKKHTEQFTSGPMLFRFINRPDDILFKQMSGCWEQCPFCKAVCTNTLPDHDSDHSVHLHRPQVLGNVCNKSPDSADEYWPEIPINTEKQFFLKFCTSVVKSSYKFFSVKSETWVPFREYRQAGPPYDRWNIEVHESEGLYWKWFICTFRAQLEEFYGGKFEGCGEIPKEWEEITKMEALKELNIMD